MNQERNRSWKKSNQEINFFNFLSMFFIDVYVPQSKFYLQLGLPYFDTFAMKHILFLTLTSNKKYLGNHNE